MSEIQHVDANGLRFAYLEEGEGPLVLLVHGFPDTARSWDAIRPKIAEKGYRAVSPWTRGYHPTEIPDRDATAEDLARDVVALIDALSEDGTAIVIAHDWGGYAGYGAAALAPERVSKLFVVGIPHPAAVKPSLAKLWGVRHFLLYKLPGAARRFARDDFRALRDIYRRWSPTWDPSEDELAPVKRAFAHPGSLHAAMGYYRTLSAKLPKMYRQKIEVDTVAFAGTDDPNLEPSDYEGARRRFTGAYTVETMPGGHFMHREHPDVFEAKLLPHL